MTESLKLKSFSLFIISLMIVSNLSAIYQGEMTQSNTYINSETYNIPQSIENIETPYRSTSPINVISSIITANPSKIKLSVKIETLCEILNVSVYLKSTQENGIWDKTNFELASYDDNVTSDEKDIGIGFESIFHIWTDGSTELNIQAKLVVWYNNSISLVCEEIELSPISITDPYVLEHSNSCILIHGLDGSTGQWDHRYYRNDDFSENYDSILKYDVYGEGRDHDTLIGDIANDLLNEILHRHRDSDENPYIYSDVDIVGYSMGGLIGRYLINHFYDDLYSVGIRIRHFFMIATPSDGSMDDYSWYCEESKQMAHGSDFLDELNEDVGDDLPYASDNHKIGIEYFTLAGNRYHIRKTWHETYKYVHDVYHAHLFYVQEHEHHHHWHDEKGHHANHRDEYYASKHDTSHWNEYNDYLGDDYMVEVDSVHLEGAKENEVFDYRWKIYEWSDWFGGMWVETDVDWEVTYLHSTLIDRHEQVDYIVDQIDDSHPDPQPSVITSTLKIANTLTSIDPLNPTIKTDANIVENSQIKLESSCSDPITEITLNIGDLSYDSDDDTSFDSATSQTLTFLMSQIDPDWMTSNLPLTYVATANVKTTLNLAGTTFNFYFKIIDDDTEAPTIVWNYEGDYTDHNSGKITWQVDDLSGISSTEIIKNVKIDETDANDNWQTIPLDSIISGQIIVPSRPSIYTYRIMTADADADRGDSDISHFYDDVESTEYEEHIIKIIDDDIETPSITCIYYGDMTDGNAGYIEWSSNDSSDISTTEISLSVKASESDPDVWQSVEVNNKYGGKINLGNELAINTYRISSTDNDYDNWEGDQMTLTIEQVFKITDDDIEAPTILATIFTPDSNPINNKDEYLTIQVKATDSSGISSISLNYNGKIYQPQSNIGDIYTFFIDDLFYTLAMQSFEIIATDNDNDRQNDQSTSNTFYYFIMEDAILYDMILSLDQLTFELEYGYITSSYFLSLIPNINEGVVEGQRWTSINLGINTMAITTTGTYTIQGNVENILGNLRELSVSFEFTSSNFKQLILNELYELRFMVENCPDECWKNKNSKNAMLNKIDETISLVECDLSLLAYSKLLHDIKPKLTGLKENENGIIYGDGTFKNKWVTCEDFENKCNTILWGLTNL